MSFKPLRLHGSIGLRVGSLLLLARSALAVLLCRTLRGPFRPSWSLAFEIATRFFQAQDVRMRALIPSGDIPRCRAIADSLIFYRPVLNEIRIEAEHCLPGTWFIAPHSGPTVLYLHGGGYVFHPKMTDNIVAALAMAVGGRTFVAHYPLAPEHPYPAQLHAARQAYQWLLERSPPSQIVFAGDAAGGHLALMLLLTLNGLPKPAAAIVISPWTDPRNASASIISNSTSDWISPAMIDQYARWAGADFAERASLAEWPDDRDLATLPPLLIHAGEAEICRDMILQFAARAMRAGAPVLCRTWPDMNHNFHRFGDMMPQSREAFAEISAFAATHCEPLERTRAANVP